METCRLSILPEITIMSYNFWILLFTGCYCLATLSCNAGTPPLEAVKIDSIVVIKHKREMQAYSKQALLMTYKIALGKQPVGPKQVQGDMRTPEGLYHINGKNPNSGYFKNLGISYPNAKDRKVAAKLGKPPGGDIKIHGLPNGQGYIGSMHRLKDWTHGCIAVTNDEMDELYQSINVGTVVYILP